MDRTNKSVDQGPGQVGAIRWHYMDAKTVSGYGPWARWEDYATLAAERDALQAKVDELEAKAQAVQKTAKPTQPTQQGE